MASTGECTHRLRPWKALGADMGNERGIAVIGSGYVGTVMAACLADLGHDVVGVEIDAAKLTMLNDGIVPFFEAGLAERILACEKSESPLQIHFVRPDKAAKKVGLESVPPADRLEALYLALALRRRPGHNYAVSGESRFSQMRGPPSGRR